VRTVDETLADQRLDVFLSRQPEIGSRAVAKALIKAGAVRVDGAWAKPGLHLATGQRVRFEPGFEAGVRPGVAGSVGAPGSSGGAGAGPDSGTEGFGAVGFSEAVGSPPRVLFEDALILVIDKPAGLVSHPSAHGRDRGSASVATWARERCPDLPVVGGEDRPGIVHRLDRETSGVMVLAKTEDAFHFLKGEFKARRVEKEYRAIAFGAPRFDSDFVERNIAPHPARGDRMVVVPEGGREASTFYEVVERFGDITLFRCLPRTGRTHQIRVHMTSVGHSLVGDKVYRSRNHSQARLPEAAPDPGRHCLHAFRLAFAHPFTREPVAFEAPLADDMAVLLAWLRAHAR
jgi:23S rRNA pseudouridine1911/1915/1917 synthase